MNLEKLSAEEPPANVLNDYDAEEYEGSNDDHKRNNREPQLRVVHRMKTEPEDVLEDGVVEMQSSQMAQRPVPHMGAVVRTVVRRVRIADAEGPSTASHLLGHGPPRKVYVRRRRTPEEELALERYEQDCSVIGNEGKRIPAPPGKRGRRPIMLPHNHTEPVSRSEAARRTGRPVIMHPSGVEFAIPSSLEAHPIQLSDIIPDNPAFDILKDDEGMPYCAQCHSVLRSFHALEYHIMSVHLKYRPFRCMFCVKEYFYTEDEVIAHLKSIHIGKPINIIRELKEDKEEELKKFFQTVFIMIREDEDLNQQRVDGLQQAAYHQMQKYHRMRFKVPEVVARQRSQRDAAAQTFVTMAAPQTMVQMPIKSHYVRRPEPLHGQVKLVQLDSGELVEQILTDDRGYLVERDLDMAEHEGYDPIDVVEDELGRHVHY